MFTHKPLHIPFNRGLSLFRNTDCCRKCPSTCSSKRAKATCSNVKNPGSSGGESLATEFSRFVNTTGVPTPLRYSRPTPMIPPTAAVEAIMTALQIVDYPEEDSGVRTAYLFSKPYNCENLVAGQGTPERARSWMAEEQWLPLLSFSQMLHQKPYCVLLGCQDWKVASQMVFPSQRMGNKAVQAVQVYCTGDSQGLRSYTFTFCLERIESGPYRGCWLVVGLREGNYATVI